MPTRPVSADERVNPPTFETAAPIGSGRYRLTVAAADICELVRFSGGWLCDQARAGWSVAVLVPDVPDASEVRPLTILGVTPLAADLESVLANARGAALAISAQLLRHDRRLTDRVLELARRGGTDIVSWGERCPDGAGRPIEAIEHRLSAAARAFKSRALLAAAVDPRTVDPTETIYPLTAGSARRLYPA